MNSFFIAETNVVGHGTLGAVTYPAGLERDGD